MIANTDAFKMGNDRIGWFIDLLQLSLQFFLSIQLLGENWSLLNRCSDIVVHSLAALDYGSPARSMKTTPSRAGTTGNPFENEDY